MKIHWEVEYNEDDEWVRMMNSSGSYENKTFEEARLLCKTYKYAGDFQNIPLRIVEVKRRIILRRLI